MRTTLNIDDDMFRKASQLTGIKEKTSLLHEGLKALRYGRLEVCVTSWVEEIMVGKEVRRQGIGRHLMQASATYFRKLL